MTPFPPDFGRTRLGKLHGVPNLPPHYLPREGSLAELKQKLLNEHGGSITGHGYEAGMQGMGGSGKTIGAAALSRDLAVRSIFSDGIYWLTIGQNPKSG